MGIAIGTTPPKPANSIDDVIIRLERIISESIATRSRLGFFAALYAKVTLKVKEGIAAGRFENGPRMESFDVIFANRHLAAFDGFRRGATPSRCWIVAFENAANRRPIILQHLLLGMNAHINFDLGIAAAQASPGAELSSLKNDFDGLNQILESMVAEVIAEISQVSPWNNLRDRIDTSSDIAIINFSIENARTYAWRLAEQLASQPLDTWEPILATVDEFTSRLGELIANPVGIVINSGLWIIRSRESGDISRITRTLVHR